MGEKMKKDKKESVRKEYGKIASGSGSLGAG
jgi:hypothetical protein